ncbi:phosphoribosylformylglycinamidine synthase [Marinitoga sp. 1135]|uniref:Phosphoribosylformylglycinamidine synthase subunit PurS n=1 Tax=Marinitoga piezophila (strain DSM 14283 / JCM 11233 / KA3) TaxID=443254 RepID=H2J4G9_MARPK|nr:MULTISPECIES: phosphoribosylformylglycinamidine synthase subunit PurS [Marinitoga]AEX84824.1 phosphoribosylformylglycinamidine synthase, purS protein [Marinitoga piezophila KA3]APT75334.1 phosphoribosylformylglycinamidine synthase [Marinitoga sp. 1137]NUU95064.1 phosphoribosylformylglycinamidine synthase [Marinitoga sp. 1135]NUU97018.1 phosphoribosylformylglycinamidine synthase [Marinitoga sp. 1138]
MKIYRFEALITLKNGILDPQGAATQKVLKRLNYKIDNVRFGKLITFDLEAENEEDAKKIAEEITYNSLINPVLENYELKLLETRELEK